MKVVFLIDRFDLYYSLHDVTKTRGVQTKWLNVAALFLSILNSRFERGAQVCDIYYFSAFAKHLSQGKVARHETYVRCLRDSEIIPIMGRFKQSNRWCRNCKMETVRWEEKETDVAIAVKLLELFHLDECDCIVLITGDTDLGPAVKTARALFAKKRVVVGFPHARSNREFRGVADSVFKLSAKNYMSHQFPDPYKLQSGRCVSKPPSW